MRLHAAPHTRIPWYERNAGLCVAVPAVLLSMAILASIRIAPRPETPEPLPMRVLVETVPDQELLLEPDPVEEPEPEELEEPEPEPDEPPMVNPELPEVIATAPDSPQRGDVVREVSRDEETADTGDEYEDPSLANFVNWAPSEQDTADLQALEREVARDLAALDQRRKDLNKSILRQEVESAAADFHLTSDGGSAGAIRLLDTSGLPDDIVRPVLEKYGMTFERRYTRPVHGRNFLNAATTNRGTFSNVSAEGYYDVLALSARALAVMSAREHQALRDRGYDPRTTRVVKITFGIVKTDCRDCDPYDFGVIDIEVEQIR